MLSLPHMPPPLPLPPSYAGGCAAQLTHTHTSHAHTACAAARAAAHAAAACAAAVTAAPRWLGSYLSRAKAEAGDLVEPGCVGPTYSLTVDGGSCELLDDGGVECSPPSVKLQGTPLTCNLPYRAAASLSVSARHRRAAAPCASGRACARCGCACRRLRMLARSMLPAWLRPSQRQRRLYCLQGEGWQYKVEFGRKRSGSIGGPAGLYNYGASLNATVPYLGLSLQTRRLANDFGVRRRRHAAGRCMLLQHARTQCATVPDLRWRPACSLCTFSLSLPLLCAAAPDCCNITRPVKHPPRRCSSGTSMSGSWCSTSLSASRPRC